MAALIRQANSGDEMADRPQTKKKKKKKKTMMEEGGKKSEKKEKARNVRDQRDKGWIHVIRVHDTTHLAVTTTLWGSRRSRTAPHKERTNSLVKHRDYPLTRTP